jgi:hypothetical protein
MRFDDRICHPGLSHRPMSGQLLGCAYMRFYALLFVARLIAIAAWHQLGAGASARLAGSRRALGGGVLRGGREGELQI